jgi:plastocyanin
MLFNIASALVALSSFTALASTTAMHVVSVGKDGKLEFCPQSITAAQGDLVQFQFYPKNHSVVQGFFAKGCTPINEAPPPVGQTGAFSGFMPVNNNTAAGTIPTFTITVNGTGPTWWYCSQAKHCEAGMVFAINPTAEKTLAGYKANCANATTNITPGQSLPAPAPAASTSAEAPPPAGDTATPPAPTVVTQPSVSSAPSAGQTSLPINSLASSTVSRTAGWVVLGLAGCLSVAMLL